MNHKGNLFFSIEGIFAEYSALPSTFWTYSGISFVFSPPTFIDHVYADIQSHISDRLRNDRSEAFIQHYRETYSEPVNPPSWMSVEIMYFSQLSRICEGLKQRADV